MEDYCINDHFIIFSGVFTYESLISIKKDSATAEVFLTPWWERKNPDDVRGLFGFIRTYFYSTMLEAQFPENRYFSGKGKPPGLRSYVEDCSATGNLCHLTVKKQPETDSLLFFRKTREGVEEYCVPVETGYADLYLYPAGNGIFSLRMKLSGTTAAFNHLSDLVFLMREKDIPCLRTASGREMTAAEFISENVLLEDRLPFFTGGFSANLFNNKLKAYIAAESELPSATHDDEEAIDNLLYEMGTVSPVGSVSADDDYSPARSYLESVMQSNSFSVFRNWKALSLFDTFTVIFNKVQPKRRGCAFYNFEDLYFPVYIQNLFLKYFCFNMNSRLSSQGLRGKDTSRLRNMFLEVKNRYLFSHISYNFLPNMIHEHLRQSLDLCTELEQVEDKIESINTFINEKSDSRTNVILGFLSVIALSSTFFDISEWIQKLFSIPDELYRNLSFSVVTVTALFCLWLFMFLNRKK